MTNTIVDTNYLDYADRKILWGNDVHNIYSYSSSNETWDRTGGGTASWYIENTLPSDIFYGNSLDNSKWSFFVTRGTISGSVNNKLVLDIVNEETRGGVTSEGKWSLTGDFDVKLYVDESSYYNEYRSETSTGLTVSISDDYKYRISKYFDGTNVGYMAHNLRGEPVHFLGWFDNGTLNTSVGEDTTTCLRIKRSGNTITSYVSTTAGFTTVGSGISGTDWIGDVDIEVEAQTKQLNTYKMDVLGINVSGTLCQSTVFTSPLRGDVAAFPENTLLLIDDYGMSIVDESNMSLWMRFVNSEEFMFKAVDTDLSASDGRIYYTTSSGLVCIDFVNDKAVWYVDGERRETDVGISGRNFNAPVYTVDSCTFITDKEALTVSARKIESNDFMSVGTASGIGLLVNHLYEKTGETGRVQKAIISSGGSLYWNDYDLTTSSGKLYYRHDLVNMVGDPSTTFSYTGYYSNSSYPISISSEGINDISVCDSGDEKLLATGHTFGIDYIDVEGRITYGPINTYNPFSDPSFSNYLGLEWTVYTSSLFKPFDIFISSDWCTAGSNSLSLTLMASNCYVQLGDFGGVYQQIDVSDVDKIYFDYRLIRNNSTNLLDLEIVLDGDIAKTVSDTVGTHTSYNNVVNVGSYSGLITFEIRIKAKYSGACENNNTFMVDNLRSVQVSPDYAIIPSSSHEVLEVLLINSSSERKIFFATADGYGAIDVSSNSLDFFNYIDTFIPLATVLSAEYTEYIDEV